jgi:predicted transcriptional regulator
MEAEQRTRRGHVNGTGEGVPSTQTETHDLVSDPDVQTILAHLEEAGSQSIAQLVGKTKLPRAYLRLHLEALADAGIITHSEGFAIVRLADHGGGVLDGE